MNLNKQKPKLKKKTAKHVLKNKQIVKRALNEPELYTAGELTYMKLWNKERKRLKRIRKEKKKEEVTLATLE